MNHSLRTYPTALLCCITTVLLTGCSDTKENIPLGKLDLAATPLALPAPKVEPLLSLPGAPELPTNVQQALTLQRAFFAQDFQTLEQTLLPLHQHYLAGSGSNAISQLFINGIKDTQLTGIDSCQQWLKTMPNSYIAHWTCGALWQAGAFAIRGTKSSSQVSQDQFQLMDERLEQSNQLLTKALNLDPKPIEVLTMLAANYYLSNKRSQAHHYLQQAEQVFPAYAPSYQVRLNFAGDEWGGDPSTKQAVYQRAQQAGVDQDALLDLNDQYLVQPSKMTNPGAARSYWEQAIAEQPTRGRLSGLLDDFIWTKNWLAALSTANRLIVSYPEDSSAFYRRAQVKAALGDMPAARQDYLTASAMGHNLALQELILANIRGGLGITQQSLDTVFQLCRYGAPLGLNTATNCIGSLYYEPSQLLPQDIPQALAWHLQSARGGYFNSQHDFGWLLYSGKANGLIDNTTAQEIGVFWLRRATEQGHTFAAGKLDEANIDRHQTAPHSNIFAQAAAEWGKIFRTVGTWF